MDEEGQGGFSETKGEGQTDRRSRSRSPIRHRDSITEHDERRDSNGRDSRDKGDRKSSRDGVSLYVSGLATRTREADLIAKFSNYGKVLNVSIIKDPHSQVSRGFGFVSMQTEQEAEEAISHINRTDVDGRNITVEKARRGRAHSPTPGCYHGSKGLDVTHRDTDRWRPSDRGVTRGGFDDRARGGDYDSYRRAYSDYDRGGLPPPRSVAYDRPYGDLRAGWDRYDDRDRYRYPDPYGAARDPPRDFRDPRDYAREYYAARPTSSIYMSAPPPSRDDRYGGGALGGASRYDSLAPPRAGASAYGRRERSRSPYTYR